MAEAEDFARAFDEMAARIRRNAAEEFAGAMLVVPATGEPLAILMVTPHAAAEQPRFWAQCKVTLDQVATERMEKMQNPDPWGRR